MKNECFSEAQITLLSLLGDNLFSVPFTPDPDTDWRAVIKESHMQSVFLTAFNRYKELSLDSNTSEYVKKKIKQYMLNNIFCFKNHSYLHNLMSENGISYCVLKGAVSAHYYAEPLARCMGDVDFYVHPDDIKRAKEIFVREGFERTDKNNDVHIVLAKDNIRLEMHFAPIGQPYGSVGEVYREYWNSILESSSILCDEPATYRATSAFHHGLITLAHMQKHLVSEGVGLRHLCDWAVFANSFTEEEFVNIFEEKLKRVGLWHFACVLSLAASEYMGMPYRKWMGNNHSLATELMADIISCGNFGKKDKQKKYEGLFISDHGRNGVETNRVIQLFRSMNMIVKSNWKIVEKIPLLYPVGWCFFSVRYIIRVLLGKREMHLVNTYKQSGKRKKFYKKLKLFEPEK